LGAVKQASFIWMKDRLGPDRLLVSFQKFFRQIVKRVTWLALWVGFSEIQ
jgi:hypothetical protein